MNPARLLRRRLLAAAALAAACACIPNAFAQDAWPSSPITWIVGWAPGGSVDLVTRMVAKQLEKKLGQSIVVENRPGASGAIALRMVASAPADGNTIITVPGPVVTAVPMPEIGKELEGVARLATGATVLVGTNSPGAPADLKSLIADAKAHPDKYSFASSGTGTGQHLTGELLKQLTGIQMRHIPYKGGSQATVDVIGGHVPLAILGVPPVLHQIQAGKLKAYAVSTAQRSPMLPDTPTMQEAGVPGFEASQWFVVAAPAGTPADHVRKLNKLIAEALAQPEIAKGLENFGLTPSPLSPQETTQFVKREETRWRGLAKEAKIPLR